MSIVLFLSAGLVACAPKQIVTPKSARTDGAIARLDARGVPNDQWVESDLTAYEVDLMRIEALDDGTNAAAIKSRRQILDRVLQKRVGRAFKATNSAANEREATPLLNERDALVSEINADGKPDVSWATEKLLKLRHKLARIDEIGRRLGQRLHLNTLDYTDFTCEVRQPLDRILTARLRLSRPLDHLAADVVL